MSELTVAKVYGQALLDAARERGKEQEILEDSETLLKLMEEDDGLGKFLNYPALSSEEKKSVICRIFEGHACDEFINFMCVVIDKRRTFALRDILRTYSKMLEREEGVSYGIVYSVEPIAKDRLEEIERQTSKLLRINVKLENHMDSSLIAGFKVLVNGKIIDASYRKRLEDLAGCLRLS